MAMRLKEPVSVQDLAWFVGARLIGSGEVQVRYISDIYKIQKDSLIFVDNPMYYNRAIYSAASAILLNEELECPPDKALLVVKDPFEAYNALAKHYAPFRPIELNISPSAKIGKGTIIEPNAIIGAEVEIGENCLIGANTVIHERTKIGDRVRVHSNSVIGTEAFHYHRNDLGEYQRWHSIGRVVIEDDVEIGACSTVDRGVSSDTLIGRGTKIDNHVHIGHDAKIGKHCLIAAQAGIAGKAIIQDYVTIFGQVGVSKEAVVGEGAVLLSQTGVSKSIPGTKQYFGTPAVEARTHFKELAALRRLPDILRRLDKIHPEFKEEENSDKD